MIKITMSPGTAEKFHSLGLLVLRLGIAGQLALVHGWSKLTSYQEMVATFPDPLGVSPHLSLGLAVFGEFFCSALVALGLWTRIAVIRFAETVRLMMSTLFTPLATP